MHLKRLNMPGFWLAPKKGNKFITRSHPGPHPLSQSFPLLVVVRDVLLEARTAAEARKIIKKGHVMIDSRPVKDPARTVGLMDSVSIPEMDKYYRVLPVSKGLSLLESSAKEMPKKLCRIKGKTVAKGGKFQISLHDGRVIITGKECRYSPGDSLLIEVPSQKILKHFPFKEGVSAIVFAGKNAGVSGKVLSVSERKSIVESNTVEIETDKGVVKTLKDYVIVGEMK